MKYVAVSALSHDGLIREHNEDSLVAGPWTLCAATTLTPQTLWLPIDDPVVVGVADGLGGHPAGEEASSLAVRWLAHAAASLSTEAAVRDALTDCNEAVYADAERNPERETMGTTIAGVAATDEAVIVFNIGDSRVYGFDANDLVQLSIDDNEAPAPGQDRSPILTQTLGGSWDLTPVQPHLTTRALGDTARYLICSDGLTDAVADKTIAAVLRDHDGGRAAFELWKATIAAGAPDNVTIALLDIATRDPSAAH
jgi:PPM family protein phosphatase